MWDFRTLSPVWVWRCLQNVCTYVMMAKVSGSFCGGSATVCMITPLTMNGRIRWDIDSDSSRLTSLQVVERSMLASPLAKESNRGRMICR